MKKTKRKNKLQYVLKLGWHDLNRAYINQLKAIEEKLLKQILERGIKNGKEKRST